MKPRLETKIKKNHNQLKMKNSQKNLKMNQLWLIRSLKKLCCFGQNFNSGGKNFLKKFANDEKKLIIIICYLA